MDNYVLHVINFGTGLSKYPPHAPCRHYYKEDTFEKAIKVDRMICLDCGMIVQYKLTKTLIKNENQ